MTKKIIKDNLTLNDIINQNDVRLGKLRICKYKGTKLKKVVLKWVKLVIMF